MVHFASLPSAAGGTTSGTRNVSFTDGTGTCSCGAPKIHDSPCVHALKAAEGAGVVLSSLLHSQDTAARWKEQYEAAGDFEIPDSAWMEECDLTATNLLMPLATPAPRGGVSKKRKEDAVRRMKDLRKKQLKGHAAAVGVPPPPPPL